jgi:hypothetical protein
MAKYVRRDLFTHRAFLLTPTEKEAARRFLAESREMGLLTAG